MSGVTVVAVDGSKHTEHTLQKAIEVAQKNDEDLVIVHVTTPHVLGPEELEYAEKRCGDKFKSLVRGDFLPDFPTDNESERKYIGDYVRAREIFQKVYGEDILKRAREQAEKAGLTNIKTVLETGDVAQVVLDIAKKHDAGLIVVGRHGHGRIREFFLGSTAQKILQQADRTVLAVE